MKNLAFVSFVLAVVFSNNVAAEDIFGEAPPTGSGVFGPGPSNEPGIFALNQTAPNPAKTSSPAKTSETKAKAVDDEDEEGEQEDQGDGIEVPGGSTMMPDETKGVIARCSEYTPLFQTLIGKYCKQGTAIKPTTVCGLWLREAKPMMCLGGTRGQVCEDSNARPPAEGPFQCLRSTAVSLGAGAISYNPQLFEDSADCGVHYLCNLEQKVGEQNMFFAYQSGPAGDFSREKPQVYNRTVREMIAMFEGSAGLRTDGMHNVQIGVAPIAPGKAYVCSVWGEYRAAHPDIPHQGQDWCADPGTPVLAPFDGIATIAGWTGSKAGILCGGQIAISVGNGTIGSLGVIRGCHLSSLAVKPGDPVKSGQIVGYVGAPGDGRSGIKRSRPHLHWQTEVVVSSTKANGRTKVKTMPFAIMAKWFDFSPYIAGTVEQNPRYQGPMTPEILSRTAKFWHSPAPVAKY